ncbi:glycoside hydrolase family 3 N-terminal domain-containing protein [Lysobacter korlensis]|uniref:beta-N-acetylhexosaminidase n=1 Tax=Lysobacter korlensis TaxID=553636 RepID=A0ABV6RMP5_9GAMM
MLARFRSALIAALAVACVVTGCAAVPPRATAPLISEPARPRAVQMNENPARAFVLRRLSAMTVAEKAASVLMLHTGGTDVDALRGLVEGNGLGGLILMGDNVPVPDSRLARITDALVTDPELPPLIAIDQEGGIVRRVHSDDGPAAGRLRSRPANETRSAFEDRAELLAGLGVNVNFGIVADATGQHGSFIRSRTLGNTPVEAAPRVAAAVRGERGRVLSTLKHFPGHGVAPGDSHSSIPGTGMGEKEWRATHALPFEAGIDAGAELVMFGHLRFDAIDPAPATMSTRWHEILRDDLGFEGVAVTDDLGMLEHSGEAEFADPVENTVRALEAGNDLLLHVGALDVDAAVEALAEAVESGRIPEERLDQAARRVLALRHSLAE